MSAWLGFPQPHPWPTAILIDEFDAGPIKRSSNDVKCRSARLTRPGFQLMHGNDPDCCFPSKILLAPRQQPARGSTLSWCNHCRKLAQLVNSHNSIKNLLIQV
jgi:hypothetical protein